MSQPSVVCLTSVRSTGNGIANFGSGSNGRQSSEAHWRGASLLVRVMHCKVEYQSVITLTWTSTFLQVCYSTVQLFCLLHQRQTFPLHNAQLIQDYEVYCWGSSFHTSSILQRTIMCKCNTVHRVSVPSQCSQKTSISTSCIVHLKIWTTYMNWGTDHIFNTLHTHMHPQRWQLKNNNIHFVSL